MRAPRYVGLSLPNVLLDYIPRPGSPPTVSIQSKRFDCKESIMEAQGPLLAGRVLLFSSLGLVGGRASSARAAARRGA
jgi:hypothetical protein